MKCVLVIEIAIIIIGEKECRLVKLRRHVFFCSFSSCYYMVEI